MSRKGTPWTEPEVVQLMRVYRRIVAKHKDDVWARVAAQMPGRDTAQCRGKVRYQLEGPRGEYVPPGKTHQVSPALRVKVPPQVLADAIARRTLVPRSLTAQFCGDPLPGRSALDGREREPPKITIPNRA